jgi:hypothetical protein
MTELPELKFKCRVCGCSAMTLAVDSTEYFNCAYQDGVGWTKVRYTAEFPKADESVRFFCAGCGQRFAVPEDLT